MTRKAKEPEPATGRCSCGGSYEVRGTPEQRAAYEASFWRSHRGKGHGRMADDATTPATEEQGSLL